MECRSARQNGARRRVHKTRARRGARITSRRRRFDPTSTASCPCAAARDNSSIWSHTSLTGRLLSLEDVGEPGGCGQDEDPDEQGGKGPAGSESSTRPGFCLCAHARLDCPRWGVVHPSLPTARAFETKEEGKEVTFLKARRESESRSTDQGGTCDLTFSRQPEIDDSRRAECDPLPLLIYPARHAEIIVNSPTFVHRER